MIVVIGCPTGRLDDGTIVAAGMASRVALAAARGGRTVQLVGKTGDDPTADGVILDLTRGGVGHVALLRDPARATPLEAAVDDEAAGEDAADAAIGGDAAAEAIDAIDANVPPGANDANVAPEVIDAALAPETNGPALEAADVDLGLRYLTEFSVVVLAEPVDPEIVTIVADAARWGESRMILVVEAGEGAPDGLPADVVVFEAPEADPDGVFASLVGSFAAQLDEGTDPGDAFRASIATDGWTGAVQD